MSCRDAREAEDREGAGDSFIESLRLLSSPKDPDIGTPESVPPCSSLPQSSDITEGEETPGEVTNGEAFVFEREKWSQFRRHSRVDLGA